MTYLANTLQCGRKWDFKALKEIFNSYFTERGLQTTSAEVGMWGIKVDTSGGRCKTESEIRSNK